MKRLSILGSTGSIGGNVLNIVEKFPQDFTVDVLAAKGNVALLARQIEQFRPMLAVVYDEKRARELKDLIGSRVDVEILHGDTGYQAAAIADSVDMTVTAMVGAAGLMPTLAAIEAGKTIALANKETLVMAGDVVMRKAAEKNIAILPVDSEHSAIFQCLQGQRRDDVHQILLTASGGPFLETPHAEFENISIDDALNHPNWKMGKKITIDSATLMNKGLEVIEAKHLFDLSRDMIEVVVHPQSIVHSMVSYRDGSVLAQMGIPDMRTPIACALSWPERIESGVKRLNLAEIHKLEFYPPDLDSFPGLGLAFQVLKAGGNAAVIFNAANEMAVDAFLQERIGFLQIPSVVSAALDACETGNISGLDAVLEYDRVARATTGKIINETKGRRNT